MLENFAINARKLKSRMLLGYKMDSANLFLFLDTSIKHRYKGAEEESIAP